jgi:phage minor structural protein
MIHILHHNNDNIVGWISKVVHDEHTQTIKNEETFDFRVHVDEPYVDQISNRTRLLIPAEDGDYREFIVDYIYDSTSSKIKEVNSKGSFVDLRKAKIIKPQVLEGQTIKTAGGMVLSGLKWQLGIIESNAIRKWDIEKYIDAYNALLALSSLFECELRFRVTTDGHSITGRYVDFLIKQGHDRGKEAVFGKDLIDIKRKINPERIVTALYCIAPEGNDGTRLEVTVTNEEAFQNWNWHGQHLIETYEPQSSDEEMTIERLTQLGEAELQKRIDAVVEYEVEAASLEHILGYEHEVVRLGDSNKIKDEHFNPPMYLGSRVISISRSIFNKAKKTFKLGEVIEYKQEDVMQAWRSLQELYGTKVIKSPTTPVGRKNTIWIKTGSIPEMIYTWSDGEWVLSGSDGQSESLYMWVKYAADVNGTGISDSPTNKKYIGLAYNKVTSSASLNPADYTWTLIQGEGVQGVPGSDGQTLYTWIRYADDILGNGLSDSPVGKTHIGLAYNKAISTESNNPADYIWSLIKGDKGDQGIQGTKGADGLSSYTHIAYANSADGVTGFSVSDSANKLYIGMYVDNVATDSTTPSKYKWSLIKGADGAQGIPGTKGADGQTPYLHIAYASSSNGSTGFSTTDATGKTFIGTYTDIIASDSTDPSKYTWALIKGDKGDKGDTGTKGDTGATGSKGENAIGLSVILNVSTFTTTVTEGSKGEVYFHGFDANGNAADVNGYLIVNGEKLTIPKQFGNVSVLGEYYWMFDTTDNLIYGVTVDKLMTFTKIRFGMTNTIFTPAANHIFFGDGYNSAVELVDSANLWASPKSISEIQSSAMTKVVESWKSDAIENGNVLIKGGLLEANTILAKHLAIGDFTNLATVSEVTESNSSSFVGGESNISNGYIVPKTAGQGYLMLCDHTPSSLRNGDKIYFEFVGSSPTSANKVITFTVWGYNSSKQHVGTASTAVTLTSTDSNYSGLVTLNDADFDTAAYFLVGFSGIADTPDVKIKRAIIRKMHGGEMIVDGTILASHIKSLNGLNVGNGKFVIDANGNVTFAGNLNGATGSFSGAVEANSLVVRPPDGSPYASGLDMKFEDIFDGKTLIFQIDAASSAATGNIVQMTLPASTDFIVEASGRNIRLNGIVFLNNSLTVSGNAIANWMKATTGIQAYELKSTDGYVRFKDNNGLEMASISTRETAKHTFIKNNNTAIKMLNGSSQIQFRDANDSIYIRATANDFYPTSKREFKKNIADYTENATQKIVSTPIRTYQFNEELEGELHHVGVILDESPYEIVDVMGEGISTYAMVSLAWKSLQEQANRVTVLEDMVLTQQDIINDMTAKMAEMMNVVSVLQKQVSELQNT